MSETLHGIDITAPDGIGLLLDFHRLTFGNAVMEAGTEEGAGQTTTAETNGTAADKAADTTTEQTTTAATTDPWANPDAARAEIEKLRRENASERVNAKTKAAEEARNELLQKLGLTKDGEKAPDPAALAAELATAREQARSNAVKLAIHTAAASNGADPSRLLDSNSFMTSINGLDPADGAAVSAAIKTAVAANKALKAAQAVGASGIELTGGTGEQGQITEAQLARMTPEDIVKAQEKGLLRNLLG